jgi:hypothetical protein
MSPQYTFPTQNSAESFSGTSSGFFSSENCAMEQVNEEEYTEDLANALRDNGLWLIDHDIGSLIFEGPNEDLNMAQNLPLPDSWNQAKPEAEVALKPEMKDGVRPEAGSKPEMKVKFRPETMPAIKVTPEPEAAPKPEMKVEVRPETMPAIKVTPEPEVGPKPEMKDTRPVTKVEDLEVEEAFRKLNLAEMTKKTGNDSSTASAESLTVMLKTDFWLEISAVFLAILLYFIGSVVLK